MNKREKLIKLCETYTEIVHILFGVITGIIVYFLFPDSELDFIMLVSVLGAILPDIDHIFSIFIYNRKTDYSKTVRRFLNDKQFRKWAHFTKVNHKNNTGIYSHNIFAMLFVFIIALLFMFRYESASWSAFFLAWFSHYLWDILEDLIFFSKLNSNWTLKFNELTKKFKL